MKSKNSALRQEALAAFQSGDSKRIWDLMEKAMARDTARAEAEIERRANAVAAFQATPTPGGRYKVISLAAKRGGLLYVIGVSYKPGDGYAVSKVSYGPDRAKAMRFSTMAATGVSEYLIRCGYAPKLEGVE
jgi:hypothetical protein